MLRNLARAGGGGRGELLHAGGATGIGGGMGGAMVSTLQELQIWPQRSPLLPPRLGRPLFVRSSVPGPFCLGT